MFERNKSPYGQWGNFLFGLSTLLEGLIRVFSLGYLHGNHRFTPVRVSGSLTKKHFAKLKERHKKIHEHVEG